MPITRFQPASGSPESGQVGRNSYAYLNAVDESPMHAPVGQMGNPGSPPPPPAPPAVPSSSSSNRNHNFKQGMSEARLFSSLPAAAGGAALGAAKSAWGDIKGAWGDTESAAKTGFNDAKSIAQEGAPEIDQAAEDIAPEVAAGGEADAGLLILAA